MPILSKRKLITNVAAYASAGGGGGGFVADGVQFNGSTDYYINAGGFTGLTATKLGTISCWVNVLATGTIFGWQNAGFGQRFMLRIQGSSAQLQLADSGGTTRFNATTNSGSGSGSGIPPDTTPLNWVGAGWHWLAFSWNLASTARTQSASNMYVTGGGLDQWDGSSFSDGTPEYAAAGYPTIGSLGFLSGPYTGGLAELVFWNNFSLDLSNTTDLRKLISSTGHPVDLGSNGSIPTGGTAASFYFRGPAAGFGTNAAGTGNMTLEAGTGVTNSPTDP